MSRSGAASRSSLLRLFLRASLLGGALLDLALAGLAIGPLLGLSSAATTLWLAPEAVSYSWLAAPALAARGAVQGLACYDQHRYADVIPWLAASWLATGLLGMLATAPMSATVERTAATAAVLGAAQLVAWRGTRA